MNPYYDVEKLRDEVIYLHSLWHQGPPQPPITTTTTHFHQPHYTSHVLRHHYPAPARTRSSLRVPSTSFKKKTKKKKKQKGRDRDNSAPDPEWPCPVRHDPDPSTGWAKPKTGPGPSSEVPQQEKERLAAVKVQKKACKALKEFLSKRDDGDDDGDDGDGGDDNVVVDEDDDGEWEEIQEFFVGLFLEDDELRGYYQRCFESGEFCCLVCGAIGKKKNGKRFKDCVALLQHSMSILRTLKRGVHRGFGMALCKVLGWDADRLPTIVMKGQPLGLEMRTPAEAEGETSLNKIVHDGDGKDDSPSYDSDDKAESLEHGNVRVEEPTKGIDQSTNNERDQDELKLDIGVQNGGGAIYEGEPDLNSVVNDGDGKDGSRSYESDDKAASLEHDDVRVEEPTLGIEQSTNNERDKLDVGVQNGGGAIYEGGT